MRNIFLLATCLFCTTIYAQLRVYHEKNNRGEYEFYCINSSFCNYTLGVVFNDFTNLRAVDGTAMPFRGVVIPGKNSLFTLTKSQAREPVHISYKIHFAKGCINPKINPDFIYLVPVKPGKQTQLYELESIGKVFGDEPEPKDWYAVRFKMEAGDTVYAARRGTVTLVRDTVELPDSNYRYVRTENFIEIFHNDCSFAEYSVLKAGGVFVQPGQVVEAGDPIGIAGGEKYKAGPQVRFAVHYNVDKEEKNIDQAGRKHNHAYVPMKFWTTESKSIKLVHGNKYVSEHPEMVITQEMSKKEIKNWKEKHHA